MCSNTDIDPIQKFNTLKVRTCSIMVIPLLPVVCECVRVWKKFNKVISEIEKTNKVFGGLGSVCMLQLPKCK